MAEQSNKPPLVGSAAQPGFSPTSGSSGPDPVAVWDTVSADFYRAYPPPQGRVSYGPLVPAEDELKLLGATAGKRVLDLGCGAGFGSVALAGSGAHVIAVDFSTRRLEIAKRLAEREEVKVEFRHAGLSELIFVPANSIDIVCSCWALNFTSHWPRVFRAVSRILAHGGIFVFSIEHPIWTCMDRSTASLVHPYKDETVVQKELIPGDPRSRIDFHTYTIGGLLALLSKEGFVVHQVLEPPAVAPPTDPWYKVYPPGLVQNLPPVLVVKCES